jgi:hypothetical protein
LLVFDPQGNEISNIALHGDQATLLPMSTTFTPSRDVVIVGSATQRDIATAWATRVTVDGDVVWDQTYEIGTSESMASGVVALPSGRLYAVGHADWFDFDLLTYGAHAWIAELSL